MTAPRQAFISVSLSRRPRLEAVFDVLRGVLQQKRITPLIFVDRYRFNAGQEREMMRQAFRDIEASDLLIAEGSHKVIGVGIEAGYAAARGIPVIYLRQAEAEYSTTLGGLAARAIVYTSPDDLGALLPPALDAFFR